jgi:hypothetical protein
MFELLVRCCFVCFVCGLFLFMFVCVCVHISLDIAFIFVCLFDVCVVLLGVFFLDCVFFFFASL